MISNAVFFMHFLPGTAPREGHGPRGRCGFRTYGPQAATENLYHLEGPGSLAQRVLEGPSGWMRMRVHVHMQLPEEHRTRLGHAKKRMLYCTVSTTRHGKTKKIPKKTDCSFGITLIPVTLAVFATSTHIKPKKYKKKAKNTPKNLLRQFMV